MKDFNEEDFADYNTILSKEGRIEGIVSSCNKDEFYESLDESIKMSLKKAKGVLINFEINREQSLFLVNDIMKDFTELTNDETEVMFMTDINNIINKDLLGYRIIITGL